MTYPIPENEKERLAAVNRLRILDTAPEESFDRITKLAQDAFDVSTAGITIIGEAGQWFKSVQGWDVEECPWDQSFCTHTIMDDGVMVVEDATQDDRFATSPFVAEEDRIRFYAGAPLSVDDGVRVGSLCIIDDEPRSFGCTERDMLLSMADVVVDLLQLGKQAQESGYLSSALECAHDAVLITEADSLDPPGPKIVWANQAFSRMTGYDVDEIIGETPRIFQGPDTDRVTLNKVRSALQKERDVDAETVNYRKDGTPYIVNWHLAPVYDENDKLTHWISVQRDVTDEKRRREHLEHEAKHDSLTGLPNRYAIEKEIQSVINNTGPDDRNTLLYLDIDEFKLINDELGHTVGDEVLVRTAEVLRKVVREQDVVSRLGGDEFVILLRGVEDPEWACTIAERLHDEMSTCFSINGNKVKVPVSVGGTLDVSVCESIEEALHVADVAMYEAKEKDDCTIVLNESSVDSPTDDRSALALEEVPDYPDRSREFSKRPA